MNHHQLSSCYATTAYQASGMLHAVTELPHAIRRSGAVRIASLAVMTLGLLGPRMASAQTVINYAGGFAGATSGSAPIWLENSAVLAGSSVQLTAINGHSANNVWYKTPVSVQAFNTTFTWTTVCPASPGRCGDGMGFMIISDPNSTNAGFTYSGYSGGQLSWSQCQASGSAVNCPGINSVLVKFDLYNNQTSGEGNFTGFYSGGEYPQAPYHPQYDMGPAGINMQSGDLMSASLTYNGTVLTETVKDTVTGATYTKSYTANIPSLVAGNTAFVGFGGATGGATATQNLRSWTYTEKASGQAVSPTFSPAGGSYTTSQSVKLVSPSAGTVICYNTTGNPATNGTNGCASGTLYTGPLTISSSETLYAAAGGSGYVNSDVGSATYVIASSPSTQAATPMFSPSGGTYSAAQSVGLSSATPGAVICYSTTGSPALNGSNGCASGTVYANPVTVSSSETLYAVAGGSGYESSAVSSANFVIQPPTPTPPPASSTVISFPNGFASQPNTLFLNNASVYAGASVQLTDNVGHRANNVWFKTPVNEQAFSTTFTFHFDCSANSSNCGDGLGFMMICACTGGNPTYNPSIGHPGFTYSGFSSGQFSWSQCNIPLTPAAQYCAGGSGSNLTQLPATILVKFDLYNNVSNSPGANETGYYTGAGGVPQAPYNPQYDMSGSGINMQSGHEFSATLTYSGTTLTETLTDTVTQATYTHTYPGVNIPAAIGANTAFVGFGAGTGAATVAAYVDSWTYMVQ